MNKKSLFAVWALLFILCAGLGFIQEPTGFLRHILFFLSLVFFLPPALILFKSIQKRDFNTVRLIRNLSGLSLLSTLILIVLNIVSALWPPLAGDILHSVLTIVSSPMICCGNWFLSMFLWACLLMICLQTLKANKKETA